eukprot:1809607-Pyramimonas_sp.AAC.1
MSQPSLGHPCLLGATLKAVWAIVGATLGYAGRYRSHPGPTSTLCPTLVNFTLAASWTAMV